MDLGERLRVLGVRPLTRPAAGVDVVPRPALPDSAVASSAPSAPPTSAPIPTLDALLPGGWSDTPHGRCFVLEYRYTLDQTHGHVKLGTLTGLPPHILGHLGRCRDFDGLDCRRLLFLDTETTGLAGGTGTYAFLIGLGYFEGDGFVVRQLFMPELESERAALYLLNMALGEAGGLVSFNGRSFDWPLLEARFTLSRMRPRGAAPTRHLDLMHAARRVWKDHLASCALGELERHILGMRRQGDIPGWLIPSLYFEYLRSGHAGALVPVFEHNRLDVLAMLGLAGHLGTLLHAPGERTLAGAEHYGLGRFYEDLAQPGDSLAAYGRALAGRLDPALRAVVVQRMTTLYRQLDRRDEALRIWEELVAGETTLIFPYVELAKHYEHRLKDYAAAERLVLRALDLYRNPWQTLGTPPRLRADLDKRLVRLRQKQGRVKRET